jgi:hypothetical protein
VAYRIAAHRFAKWEVPSTAATSTAATSTAATSSDIDRRDIERHRTHRHARAIGDDDDEADGDYEGQFPTLDGDAFCESDADAPVSASGVGATSSSRPLIEP